MSSGRDEMMSRWSEEVMSRKTTNRIAREVEMLGYASKDTHMDGFYGWGQKRKLYEVLWAVQKALKESPTFVGEKEWVEENAPTRD